MNAPRVEQTGLDGVLKIAPARFADERGYFSETYNRTAFREIGLVCDFVQDNHSVSRKRGTVRGLHFQIPPFAQAKLVRVVRGAIWDVAVDLRRESPSFARSVGVTLTAGNGQQLFVPVGFAHGFCTLEDNTEVLYKVDSPHSREHERGLCWNDPVLRIAWPIADAEAILNERDRDLPCLDELPAHF